METYNYKHIEPRLSKSAKSILEKRYLIKDKEGKVVELPANMFWRVAETIANADKKFDDKTDTSALKEKFYTIMANVEFLPNSPTLMNAGRQLGQLSACFVLPVGDSMEEIFDAVKNTALIHKSGGGTGFDFSLIRPMNDIVQSTAGISSGPVSFMRVFDNTTETVKQGGTRRGANIAVLCVDHPDILAFIICKDEQQQLNNFNISVGLTDEFMAAKDKDEFYPLINPRNGEITGTLKARDVFDRIVNQAWKNGDPGVLFLGPLNQANPTPNIGKIAATNPCGELPLLPYESCNLGSINLGLMVREGHVDWQRLKEVVHLAVHFLDNVIELNKYPLPQIAQMTYANRKIGLGVMGWADMLIALGIPYNSDRAIVLAEELMKFINDEGHKASRELAKERGAFPNFKGSLYDLQGKEPIRNATVTTIAPTGTISIIANASSGIEPLYAISYTREIMEGMVFTEVHPRFERIAKERGFYSEKLMDKIAESGSVQGLDEIPDDLRKIFLAAHDISPKDHVRMQAAFQKNTDNAVSKTVNLSHKATVDDVRTIFEMAYRQGCKGTTIYRDGSRDRQVLSTVTKPSNPTSPDKPAVRVRPMSLKGWTHRMQTGCGPLYVTINEDQEGLFELFTTMGKAGGCAASQSEAIGRMVSLAWRSGIKPIQIIKQLLDISCHSPSGFGENKIMSCADAVAKAIQRHMSSNGHAVSETIVTKPLIKGACRECGGQIIYEVRCLFCRTCGKSECP